MEQEKVSSESKQIKTNQNRRRSRKRHKHSHTMYRVGTHFKSGLRSQSVWQNEKKNVFKLNLPDQAHRAIPIWQWVQKPSIVHCHPMFD